MNIKDSPTFQVCEEYFCTITGMRQQYTVAVLLGTLESQPQTPPNLTLSTLVLLLE